MGCEPDILGCRLLSTKRLERSKVEGSVSFLIGHAGDKGSLILILGICRMLLVKVWEAH